MIDTIEVKDTITNCFFRFSEVSDEMNEINALLGQIDSLLEKDSWTGEARDKCRQIQQAVRLYYNNIRGLIGELEADTKQLKSDADAFPGRSESMQGIKSI